MQSDNITSRNMEDIYRKTCWYWETPAICRTFITSDSRSGYRIWLVKLCDADIVKLKSCDVCLDVKRSTVLFTFELEHCIEHVYFGLCQSTHMVSEKFKHFNIL